MVNSVQRALDILDLFDHQHAEMGVTELAKRMDLPKSTAAGLVTTLKKNGYLEQNGETKKYRLGYKLAERTGMLFSQFDLRHIASPYIDRLWSHSQESVNLAVRDGGEVVYIERLHGTHKLSMRSEVGKRERVHSTALGKSLVAFIPTDEMTEFIRSYTFAAVTPNTITDPSEFMLELQRVRQRGYAIDDEENELGGRCVAAPILDLHERPIAALSVSGPVQRMTDEQVRKLGEMVRETSLEISTKLGARPLFYPE